MNTAKRLSEIFIGNMSAHGTYTMGGKEGEKVTGIARTLRHGPTEQDWEKHVSGSQGLGIIAINEGSDCKFGAIDIDIYPLDYVKIAKAIREYGLPLIPIKSKSGGLHLYLFTKEWVNAVIFQGKLKEFAIRLGYGDCEIFPKQTEILVERGDVGNWINMPYFNIVDGKSERCGVYPDGTLMSITDFIAEWEEVSVTKLDLINNTIDLVDTMVDGPPCLQTMLSNKVGQGGRNSTLTNITVYLKKVDIDSVLERALNINEKYFDPPMDTGELRNTVSSVLKKDYDYSCNAYPIKKYCNKELCHTRKFGTVKLAYSDFKLENLHKYDTEPPIWFVNIVGVGKRIELTTEELISQAKFQIRCIDVLNISPPKISATVWTGMIQKLMEKVVIVEASVDTSPKGQLWELVEKFCTSRIQAKSIDELLLGKPFLDAGNHYFRLSDLMLFLSRNNFKEFRVNQVANILKEKGSNSITQEIRKKDVDYWSVKEFVVNKDKFKSDIYSKGDSL